MSTRFKRWAFAPVWALVCALALAASPVIGAIGRVTARLGKPELLVVSRLIRAYVAGEMAFLAAARRNASSAPERLYSLLASFLDDLVQTAITTLRLRVHVEADEATRQALTAHERPVLVLSRHAGPGDSILLVHLLLSEFGRRPRIVMKQNLALDPAIGLFTQRLPNVLIDGDQDACCAAIGEVSANLDARGALLLFPEGGNFTPRRRLAAISSLRRRGQLRRARRAQDLEYMIPPRPGGAQAAMAGAPEADIVFSAHTGLGQAAKGLEILLNLPRDSTFEIRLWLAPAAERPSGPDEQVAWLDEWWARLDRWVDGEGREAPANGDSQA